MTAVLIEDAKVLIPNPEHKNFTETEEVLKQGEEITGEPKVISGLRRGEPFDYKLFLTNNNKLIYIKKIKTMENQSGADAVVVNLKQNILAKPSILGAIGGALLGFGYAKYKKHDMKKVGMYVLVGGVAGFAIGKLIAHTAKIKSINPEK